MAETRPSATQRIQVGIIGLIVVLLFVSLANMALDRANDSAAASQNSGTTGTTAAGAAEDAAPGEPLAELGVTPAAKEETPSPASNQNRSNLRTAPTNRQR